MSKQCSSCYSAVFCWGNLHPGIHINPILALGTYQKCSVGRLRPKHANIFAPQEPRPPPGQQWVPQHIFFRRCSKNTSKDLRCSFRLQIPQTAMWQDLMASSTETPPHNPQGPKALMITSSHQAPQETLSCSLSRPGVSKLRPAGQLRPVVRRLLARSKF